MDKNFKKIHKNKQGEIFVIFWIPHFLHTVGGGWWEISKLPTDLPSKFRKARIFQRQWEYSEIFRTTRNVFGILPLLPFSEKIKISECLGIKFLVNISISIDIFWESCDFFENFEEFPRILNASVKLGLWVWHFLNNWSRGWGYNHSFSTDKSLLELIRVPPSHQKKFSTPSKKFLTRFLGDSEGSFFSIFFRKKVEKIFENFPEISETDVRNPFLLHFWATFSKTPEKVITVPPRHKNW